jgi:hypothetical protein
MKLGLYEYFRFVEERHHIWEARRDGAPAPWTDDPILSSAKFTNVYRVLDAGSQFLLRELLLPVKDDILSVATRAFIYRFNNRPEPWTYFKEALGEYPRAVDLLDGTLFEVWERRKAEGLPIFGTAYRMNSVCENRTEMVLRHARTMIASGVPELLLEHDGDPVKQWETLKTVPTVGDFLAMQILTDIGYSGVLPQYDEDMWVAPGPGCIAGAAVLGLDPREAINKAWAYFQRFQTVMLDGMSPSLMDIQNTWCEFSKYARYASGGKPRAYRPAGTDHTHYVLPARWTS